MKKVGVQRLCYYTWSGERKAIGAMEYDLSLDRDNILNAVHEVGKTQWIGSQLWLIRNGVPTLYITVEPFYTYQKSILERLLDALRR